MARNTTAPPCTAMLLVVLVFAAGCGKSEQQAPKRPPAPVSVLTVAPQTVPYTSSFVAQTESSQQVDIVARVSGFLDKIAYREGELVRGPSLLQLVSRIIKRTAPQRTRNRAGA